jgi:predicted nucleic acid-binding Zn ribbon protein
MSSFSLYQLIFRERMGCGKALSSESSSGGARGKTKMDADRHRRDRSDMLVLLLLLLLLLLVEFAAEKNLNGLSIQSMLQTGTFDAEFFFIKCISNTY